MADSFPVLRNKSKGPEGDIKEIETTTKDDHMDCSSEDLNETEKIVSRPIIKPRKITLSKEPVVSKYKVRFYLLVR